MIDRESYRLTQNGIRYAISYPGSHKPPKEIVVEVVEKYSLQKDFCDVFNVNYCRLV